MEKGIEKKFRDGCLKLGCQVVKFVDPARVGGPDRMVLLPGGLAVFVEIKDVDKMPRRSQLEYMIDLNKLGFLAFWCFDVPYALEAIRAIKDSTNRSELVAELCTRQIRLLERQR